MIKLISTLAVFVLLACKAQVNELSQEIEVKKQNFDLDIENPMSLKTIVNDRKIQPKDLMIVVYKSERKVQVFFQSEKLIEYPCVLGFEPIGDKMQEGDGKTPEGKFKIKAMYPHKSWSYFIWFDYPNDNSNKKFKERKANNIISESATIGGDIGFHGVPEKNDEIIKKKIDWTLGCISLSTENITDLYQSIGKETSIEIRK